MPPRRPGGKYKALCGRVKGEETLAQEALEKENREMKGRSAARAEERRQKEMMAQAGLRSAKEEQELQVKQRILNLLCGSKKGSANKFFHCWIVGIEASKKEKVLRDRDRRWKKGCIEGESAVGRVVSVTLPNEFNEPKKRNVLVEKFNPRLGTYTVSSRDFVDDDLDLDTLLRTGKANYYGELPAAPGCSCYGCKSFSCLRSNNFELPFDAACRETFGSNSAFGCTSGSLRGSAQLHGSSEPNLHGLNSATLRPSTTTPGSTHRRGGMLPPMVRPATSSSVQPRKFLGENPETVLHHRSGVKCHFDREFFRFAFVDALTSPWDVVRQLEAKCMNKTSCVDVRQPFLQRPEAGEEGSDLSCLTPLRPGMKMRVLRIADGNAYEAMAMKSTKSSYDTPLSNQQSICSKVEQEDAPKGWVYGHIIGEPEKTGWFPDTVGRPPSAPPNEVDSDGFVVGYV